MYKPKNYQFFHRGTLLNSRYCRYEIALQIALNLAKEKGLEAGSILITTNPNAE